MPPRSKQPIPDDMKDKFARRRVPLRRYGEPEEVAQMTLSLVLPAASYCNGVVIPVDGGMTIQNTWRHVTGFSRDASSAPVSANGSANTEWLNRTNEA